MKKKLLPAVLTIFACSVVFFAVRHVEKPVTSFDPNQADNLLALSQIWEAAKNLYCYFELLPEGFNFDREYQSAFEKVAQVKSEYAYYLELNQFLAVLQDGHGVVIPPDTDFLGKLPFSLSYIENSYCVSATGNSQIPLYSQLLSIDGVKTQEYLEKNIAPYVGIQTERAHEESVAHFFTDMGERSTAVHLEFLLPSGEKSSCTCTYGGAIKLQQATVLGKTREGQIYASDTFVLRKADPLKGIEGNLLILEVYSLKSDPRAELTTSILPRMKGATGCVIDLRKCGGGNSVNGYAILYPFVENEVINHARPLGTVTQIKSTRDMMMAQLLLEKEALLSQGFSQKDLDGLYSKLPKAAVARGQEMLLGKYTTQTCDELASAVESFYLQEFLQPEEKSDWSQWFGALPKSSTPIVLLVNQHTGSAGDDMTAVAKEWGVPVVGTNTRGATGNIMLITLCNGWTVGFSSQRVIAPDGSEIWNKGISPDIYADYTLDDFKNGIDDPLHTAMGVLETP